jgi:hypothetical protein
MITLKPATSRLTVRAASTAFAALLALGLPLAAQSRGGHGGGGGGGDRSAHSSGGGSHSSSGGGHSSGGRTAHGTPGGSSSGGQRQPGHGGHGDGGHGDGGHGGHGGHGGGGYWRGGHFYYYPFGFGFGFWPGYWDGWYGGYYGDPYYYPYYRGDGGYYNRESREEMGALDLDVSPGRTHVFVNGEDLGIVDKYDGWPGYLWLPEGTYDIAFYLPGYKTIARQITIYPGSVIDIDDSMEKGNAVRPEDLATKTHERRDNRQRYERERQQWLDHQNGDRNDDDQDWHDRVRHERGTMRNDQDRDDDHGDDRSQGRMRDDSAGTHLRLSVEPKDASVYLDGQFVGTGTDLSLLHAGLPVAPGHHKLAVVRPGHKAIEKEFDVKSGGNLELEISLESGGR